MTKSLAHMVLETIAKKENYAQKCNMETTAIKALAPL